MTDIHPPLAVNGSDVRPKIAQPTQLPEYAPGEAAQDDDGQISCFCGIDEDDGNTVACDLCNRWQHIRCYYPSHADGELPSELQHFCVDCKPRPFDAQAASQRQREARGHKDNLKRPSSKGQRKKPSGFAAKEANGAREGPPSKRPKTSHRSSNSTQLKRSTSTPLESTRMYSSDFVSTYQNDEYKIPSTNCLDNLSIGVRMKEWLCNAEEVYRICKMSPPDLFQRYDADISSIDPQMDLISIQEMSDERFRLPDGTFPTWKFATLKEGLSTQACIGELRGHIGLKEDYEADPNNKWNVLRHPAPFVFYHPHLPLYIDARNEGTVVRYIRRSCSPNAELRIIITDDSDYHFCFIATRDIEAGEQVAIAWDSARSLTESVAARSSDAFSPSDFESVQQWVSTVLHHCGPCACDRPDCWMARFDRRPEIEFESVRPSKKRKKQHLSPLNTSANSRSGSEVRKVEDDDSRSASVSTGKESASRDITPNTVYTANGAPELSERERKKLAKEEEIFKRQEAEAHGKSMKKKRASGGTKANSPAEKRRHGNARQGAGRRSDNARADPQDGQSKRTYIDSGIQCDMDVVEAERRRSALMLERRPRKSIHRRILERCMESNEIWARQRQAARNFAAALRNVQKLPTDLPPIETTSSDVSSTVKVESDSIVDASLDTTTPKLNGAHSMAPFTALTVESAIVQSPASLVPPESLLSPPIQTARLPNTPVRKKMSLSEWSKQRKAKEHEAKPDREGEKDQDSSPMSFISTPATSLESTDQNGKPALQPVAEDITMEDAGVTVNA